MPTNLPASAALMPAATLLVALSGTAYAATATTSASFTASATVEAACTISSRLSADPQAALAAATTMCRAPPAGPPGSIVIAPRPQIRVEHDTAAGVTRVVFAF